MTPAGIKPATFRLVAQHLNHCATAVPQAVQFRKEIQDVSFVLSLITALSPDIPADTGFVCDKPAVFRDKIKKKMCCISEAEFDFQRHCTCVTFNLRRNGGRSWLAAR